MLKHCFLATCVLLSIVFPAQQSQMELKWCYVTTEDKQNQDPNALVCLGRKCLVVCSALQCAGRPVLELILFSLIKAEKWD